MSEAVERYIVAASRLLAAAIEAAIQQVIDEDGLTADGLKSRAVIVHEDGVACLTIDGTSRVAWREGALDPKS